MRLDVQQETIRLDEAGQRIRALAADVGADPWIVAQSFPELVFRK